MPLVETLKYKDIIDLAESNDKALIKTIKQLGGSSVASFTDEELCSSFLSAYMKMNKLPTASKDDIKKATGLNIEEIFGELKMSGARRNRTARHTKSEEAVYALKGSNLVRLTNTSDSKGCIINASYNAYTLADLYNDYMYNGYVKEEDGTITKCKRTLRTLAPNVISMNSTFLVGNSYLKNGANKYGISSIAKSKYVDEETTGTCYNMNLRQIFSALLYLFCNQFGVDYFLYKLVSLRKVKSLNDVFEVIPAKGSSLLPIYNDAEAKKNCLYVHHNFEVGTIESQLSFLKDLKDCINLTAPIYNKKFKPITDEAFDDFCKQVIFYSAFDKESQGNWFDANDKKNVVNLL